MRAVYHALKGADSKEHALRKYLSKNVLADLVKNESWQYRPKHGSLLESAL